jgi:preprotein translocase subunit SecD
MLHFTRARALTVLLSALIICAFAIPNFFSKQTVQAWPKWAQRHMVLGLDLQGGVSLLLQVDEGAVRKERIETLRDDVRRVLRDDRIRYTGLTIRGQTVEVRISDAADVPKAMPKLRQLSQPLGGLLSGSGQNSLEISESSGLVRLTMTEPAINDRIRQAVDQSIQVLAKRIDSLGTVEPSIQRQGAARILVQVPGLENPDRLKELIGKTAKLTFHLVDTTLSQEQIQQGRLPAGFITARGTKAEGGGVYVLEERPIVAGADLVDAQPGFDQRTSEPIVSFRFNSNGARAFGRATQENVGKPFAILLDGEVISAPVIREPIIGGSGQISGNFTVEAANDLAIVLRSGALAAPMSIVEERNVGPGLGADSIRAGILASILGGILVIVFMVWTYGLLGMIANLAVAINVGMIIGILSLINATLTLPGIAGIVLTVGIAVDSNVLIYERIREEWRAGRTALMAIDAGFHRALATILDTNITTFIAAAVLFFIGTGPVKGFAVTFGIGILTTVFTAFTLTRLIVAFWVRWRRPKVIPI